VALPSQSAYQTEDRPYGYFCVGLVAYTALARGSVLQCSLVNVVRLPTKKRLIIEKY